MRVIAGRYKRLTLSTPKGLDTRPTTDRIKETLFNIIGNDVADSNFLDLFAGSGQIGIEALSRYAKSATFIDNNRASVDCIKSNLDKCHIGDEATVINDSCITALKRFKSNSFDVVFMDPPYGNGLEKDILEYLSDSDILTDDALIIVESDLTTEFDYVEKLGYEPVQDKQYKTNRHLILRMI